MFPSYFWPVVVLHPCRGRSFLTISTLLWQCQCDAIIQSASAWDWKEGRSQIPTKAAATATSSMSGGRTKRTKRPRYAARWIYDAGSAVCSVPKREGARWLLVSVALICYNDRGRAISDEEERAFIMWGDVWELLCCAKPQTVVCFVAITLLRADKIQAESCSGHSEVLLPSLLHGWIDVAWFFHGLFAPRLHRAKSLSLSLCQNFCPREIGRYREQHRLFRRRRCRV